MGYLWRTKNRYLTALPDETEKLIEKYVTEATKAEATGISAVYLWYEGRREKRSGTKSKNKQSTLDAGKMKSTSSQNEEILLSFESFLPSNTGSKDGTPLVEPLSPLRSPATDTYKIPKRVTPEIRIVPLPEVRKPAQIKKTYATSSKAKPKARPNGNLVQTRDPRIAKQRKKPYNIPLSARNEFEANVEHIKWIEDTAVPSCQQLIANSRQIIDDLQGERTAIESQLDAVKVLQGELEHKKACYDLCGVRMRLDERIRQVIADFLKQQSALKDLDNTRQRLSARNDKLCRASRRAFSGPIPLLPRVAQVGGDGQTVPPHTREVDPVIVMKPKPNTEQEGDMETDPPHREPGTKQKLLTIVLANFDKPEENDGNGIDLIEYLYLLPGKHNVSDPFFDADATVIESEESLTSSQADEAESDKADTDSKTGDGDEAATPGGNITTRMQQLGGPKPIPAAVKKDLDGVSGAVI